MHNATFLPHTSNSQVPSAKRDSSPYRQSTTKKGLKRFPSFESLPSIGSRTSGTGTGSGIGKGITSLNTNTRTGGRTRSTIISTTTTTTGIAKTVITTTASSSSTSSGTPLRRRDQNAGPVTGSWLKESGTRNMPFDTSSPPPTPANANTNRPQMPSLSAAAARAINRNPLTPKIASKTTPQAPTLAAVATPTNRRQQTPTLATFSRETPSNRSSYFEEPSSFASHLNSNITPRSGSRQNRVDSANSTPNGTPNPERSEPWDPKSSFALPSPRLEGDIMRRSAVSLSSISPDVGGHGRQDGIHSSESKFFHASDIKTSRPTSSSKVAQAKSPTFFYANGNTIENKPTSPTIFSPSAGQAQDSISSKFMYANGTPELRNSPTPPISRNSSSAASTAPKAVTSRPATNPPTTNHSVTQRPISPVKPASQVPQASSKTSNVQGPNRPPVLSNPQLGPSPGLRRSSTGKIRPGGHSRAGSLAKVDQTASAPKLMSAQVSPTASPPITVPSTPAPLTLASIIQAAEEFAENEENESPDELRSGLQSPTKSVHSTEPANELVANARRERKVQDLQITNASLEAINRTLERQLRKQTTELRRFRRLSRAGRLSLPSSVMSSRVSSETISEHGIGTGIMDLSDLSEQSEAEKEEEEEKEEESSSLDSDSASGSLSPSIVAERDSKHRRRDEKRLQVDLSNHQQLLIDSQKINQSIKRCLNWTEELINEGKKALEYKVMVSDVELGGRVLDPLDMEDERPVTEDGSLDDTSLADDTSMLDEILNDKLIDAPRLAGWSYERQDRDSGIELPVDGG
ncbi:hypothetical protein F4804DRAFT_321214 [Jackrogersella minutella]|nr:hypothetical protein F4804DRAFT_321214 [Jackrogersella minutella]